MNNDTMTEQDTGTIMDKTTMPTANLDQKIDARKNGNGKTHPGPFSELSLNGEIDAQKKQFNDNVRTIGILMRDHGHTQFEVRHFERTLPQLNNVTKESKQSIIDQLSQSRIEWAISNFPIYTDRLFTTISPEQPERVAKLKEEFTRKNTTRERKAEISEEIRTELETVVHWKTMFYTDMLKTVMVDIGETTEQAEETALLKAEEITSRAISMVEKVSTFETLRKEALTHLIEHLPVSIEVWEELHPGEGQVEEDKIRGERSEVRMRNAKELFKKTTAELERLHAAYRLKAEVYFKHKEGESSGQAYKRAVSSLSQLQTKPRLEQIRIMKTPGRFI